MQEPKEALRIVAITIYFSIIRYQLPRVNRRACRRLVTITYGYRYLGGRKKLTLITELCSAYMVPLLPVSRGKTGEADSGKRDYRNTRHKCLSWLVHKFPLSFCLQNFKRLGGCDILEMHLRVIPCNSIVF
jgi:hypothetical protein